MDLQSQNIPAKNLPTNVKKELGQFYTTNYNYIFQGLDIAPGSEIIEPFCGTGVLCNWCNSKGFYEIESYDLDPKSGFIIQRDTIMNPPNYKGKFVVTNPPFLASNKTKNKAPFEKWDTNDLSKCFIKSLVDGECGGGVIILPLNFFCDDRKTEARDEFLSNYVIEKLNIFEEAVFDDTKNIICSLQFRKITSVKSSQTIETIFYPSKEQISLTIEKTNNWKVAPEVYRKEKTCYKISRLLHTKVLGDHYRNKVLKPEKINKITNIFLYAVDSGSNSKRISLSYNVVPLLAKDTDRTFATIVIDPPISHDSQKKIIEKFNKEIEVLRKKYNSLFLVNFRNSSKSYSRKRLGFGMAYNMIAKIINQMESKVEEEKI